MSVSSQSNTHPIEPNALSRVQQMHFGEKVKPTFSAAEMTRRQTALRGILAEKQLDAGILTSYHNINYYADFLFCGFGRRFAFVVTQDAAVSVTPGIDAGQPWRRTFGDNITYTDWRRDNFFHALALQLPKAKRIGLEFDTMSLDTFRLFQETFPDASFVDIGQATMWERSIKSEEEIALIRQGARIADLGGSAIANFVRPGAREHEVALAGTQAMVREIARTFPNAELMDTWVWFQSGINTDGAHNPVTSRAVRKGDILSLNCFPMIAGYYTALERTLFCDHASDAHLKIWNVNVEVHKRGRELIRPRARCCDIARELNEIYRGYGLLGYRSFGYGHSFGVLSHYYGREAGVELREDVETVLQPGMVVSMEPMLSIPEGMAGAGGYREHDILVVGKDGAENITAFPFGPEHNILRA